MFESPSGRIWVRLSGLARCGGFTLVCYTIWTDSSIHDAVLELKKESTGASLLAGATAGAVEGFLTVRLFPLFCTLVGSIPADYKPAIVPFRIHQDRGTVRPQIWRKGRPRIDSSASTLPTLTKFNFLDRHRARYKSSGRHGHVMVYWDFTPEWGLW